MQEQNDQPKVFGFTGDQSTSEDLLGFKPYVQALAAFLIDPATKPPLTVSIEGEWGRGKSSFQRQLQEELKKNVHTFYSISFNPWRYNDNESLWAAFAIEFEQAIYKTVPWYRKLRFNLGQLNSKKIGWDILKISLLIFIICFLNWLLYVFNLHGQFRTIFITLSLVSAFFSLNDFIKEIVNKIKSNIISVQLKDYLKERPNYRGKIPFLDQFSDDLKNIASTLCNNSPIYVFIDDLDRCEPEQSLELMQALNLLIFDNLKIIFILAVDRKKVAAGYAEKHAHLVQYLKPFEFESSNINSQQIKIYNALQYGYEYMEKFIQIPFFLPTPKISDLKELVKTTSASNPNLEIIDNNAENTQTSKENSSNFEVKKTGIVSKIEQLENASNEIEDILNMIAPALRNNPRSIKKFYNLFRLQVYIGSYTGLFSLKGINSSYREISIFQLAKVLVVMQVWPEFIEDWKKYHYLVQYISDLDSNPRDLEKFKKSVCSSNGYITDTIKNEDRWVILNHWYSYKDLVNVVLYNNYLEKTYEISAFPLERILDVCETYQPELFNIEEKENKPLSNLECSHNFRPVKSRDIREYKGKI